LHFDLQASVVPLYNQKLDGRGDTMSGWLDVPKTDATGMFRVLKIKNTNEVMALGVKSGDVLHLKGVGSFVIERVVSGSIDKNNPFLSITLER
jgi:hypothetical protein